MPHDWRCQPTLLRCHSWTYTKPHAWYQSTICSWQSNCQIIPGYSHIGAAALVTSIAKCALSRGRSGGGLKKRSPSLRGASGACPADRPPAASRHYLQLDGTYLVSTVPPAAKTKVCADAVTWPDEVQAQSILPVALALSRAPRMFGVRTSTFAPVNGAILAVL